MAEDKKEALLEFPKSMQDVSEAVRLNIDNLEKEVTVLKKSLETAKNQMEKVEDDVKEQMSEFLEVKFILISYSTDSNQTKVIYCSANIFLILC